MTTFIERMRIMANDKEEVQRTYVDEYEKKKETRKDALFKSLTFRYYNQIKKAIEHASKHGRQYVYMNFDRDAFKADFHGLGNPAQFQRLWLQELCNPDSKYLDIPSFRFSNIEESFSSSSNKQELFKFTNQNSVFDQPCTKRESFNGVNFDVWNNVKFTTVFSWDEGINNKAMCHYHTRHWKDEIKTV